MTKAMSRLKRLNTTGVYDTQPSLHGIITKLFGWMETRMMPSCRASDAAAVMCSASIFRIE